MTQPAKGQEQSMEDILASIRRIIADDPARMARPEKEIKPLSANAAQVEAQAGAHVHTGRTNESRASFEPVSTQTPYKYQLARGEPAAATPSVAPQPVQLDKLEAEIRSFRPPTPQALSLEQTDADILETQDGQAQHDQPFAQTQETAQEQAQEVVQEEFQEEESYEDIPQQTQLAASAAAHRVQDPCRDPAGATRHIAHEETEAGLVSASTTRAVDSAFKTLAHTVLVQNGPTLEDLVTQMLRPMLKTWLDDNLPRLVERLVRAEIERVSRGRP
jgi:cell pole-organizing protein PopZ